VQLVNGTASTIFIQKSTMKFVFKNKQLLCLLHEKAEHKHVDEIDAWGSHFYNLPWQGIKPGII
jgi:hypothetical protein